MASPAQILANRQNAALSTGPATAAGRDTASKNAIRHGLTGIFTPLPHENREEFEQIAASLRDEFSPDDENETFLVDQMIQARCRLHRIQRLEDHAYDQILTEPGSADDPDSRILAAMSKSGNLLDKVQRYRGAAERSYYKALRELQSSRVRNHRAESNALEAYIKKVIFAPVPGEFERKQYHGAVNEFIAAHPELQNEANSAATPSTRPRRSGYPENLALCL